MSGLPSAAAQGPARDPLAWLPGRGRPRSPAAAVRVELARAVGGLALLPARVADFLVCNRALRGELANLLGRAHPVADPPPAAVPTDRPLGVFVSCAEASGELHAVHLVRALREELAARGAPEPRVVGLGGPRLAAQGVDLAADPVSRAAMGFQGMGSSLPYYLGVLRAAAERFERGGLDLVVPVDSPALHVPLARIARRYGLPVVHHVSPQLWGWAPWRARAYARAVDRTLTILPFEPAWFARRGVPTTHVGHPLMDELARVAAPAAEAKPESSPAFGRSLALLPGSREGVIERNLPWMLRQVEHLATRVPGLRAVVVQAEDRHAPLVTRLVEDAARAATALAAPVRVESGDLHGSLARADAAFTVSGTILIDLAWRRLPTVVVYRVAGRRDVWMYRHLLSTPHFASVNLVLGREVLPEFCFAGEGPRGAIAAALERALLDRAWIRTTREALARATERLGPPGASRRAARAALLALGGAGAEVRPVAGPPDREAAAPASPAPASARAPAPDGPSGPNGPGEPAGVGGGGPG